MENVNRIKLNNNLRPMYVKEIIFEHTDETHFISVCEILAILESNYGVVSTRKTIYDDIVMLIESGYDIECVKGNINNSNMYHVLSREFDLAELRLMIDAINTIQSLSTSKSNSLIKKISRLAGPSADYLLQNTTVQNIKRTDNDLVYYIIDTIYSAIFMKKQIVFKYYEGLIGTKQTSKKTVIYPVSPYNLICKKGCYYLIGYSKKHERITAFRVDYICGIPDIMDTDSVPEPKKLYAENYIPEAKSTDNDIETEVLLEFESSNIDIVIEHFGQDIDISNIGKANCTAKVDVEPDSEFFAWIFSLAGKVRIVGPRNTVNRYIRMVSREMARL